MLSSSTTCCRQSSLYCLCSHSRLLDFNCCIYHCNKPLRLSFGKWAVTEAVERGRLKERACCSVLSPFYLHLILSTSEGQERTEPPGSPGPHSSTGRTILPAAGEKSLKQMAKQPHVLWIRLLSDVLGGPSSDRHVFHSPLTPFLVPSRHPLNAQNT